METINNQIQPSSNTLKVWEILETVCDPEIPVLSVVDLGIIRSVEIILPDAICLETVSSNPLETNATILVTITPTYTGCPAMDMIASEIKMALLAEGFENIQVNTTLSPAWTTDWMSEAGKEKLKSYGIAPPIGKQINQAYLEDLVVPCPRCNSTNTKLVSAFSSTPCKALFKCVDCLEPFDYFKCH